MNNLFSDFYQSILVCVGIWIICAFFLKLLSSFGNDRSKLKMGGDLVFRRYTTGLMILFGVAFSGFIAAFAGYVAWAIVDSVVNLESSFLGWFVAAGLLPHLVAKASAEIHLRSDHASGSES